MTTVWFKRCLCLGLLLPALSLAQNPSPDPLEGMANGRHGFRSVDPVLYQDAQVAPVQDAKVALADLDFFEWLGVDVSSPGALERFEKKALSLFALKVAEGGSRTYFATHYLTDKPASKAAGDGRVVWLGEIVIKNAAGESIHLDVTAKGIGLPLAPKGAASAQNSSKDGLLGLREAVHSFFVSKRNIAQGLDSTLDVLVIRLPYNKSGNDPAAITVRVGSQLRPAHQAYAAVHGGPESSSRLLDYVLDRNIPPAKLGLSRAHQLVEYVKLAVSNAAEEAARAKDLHFVHGMLHSSNFSEAGGSIDFGTSKQLDAPQPKEFQNRFVQTFVAEDYVSLLLWGLGIHTSHPYRDKTVNGRKVFENIFPMLSYPLLERMGFSAPEVATIRSEAGLDAMTALFREVYVTMQADLWLARVGLSAEERAALDTEKKKDLIKNLGFMQDDVRSTLHLDFDSFAKNSLEAIRQTDPRSRLQTALKTDRKWYTHPWDPMQGILLKFLDQLKALIDTLPHPPDPARAKARAEAAFARFRPAAGPDTAEDTLLAEEEALLQRASTPAVDWVALSRETLHLAEESAFRVPVDRHAQTRMNVLNAMARGSSDLPSLPTRGLRCIVNSLKGTAR